MNFSLPATIAITTASLLGAGIFAAPSIAEAKPSVQTQSFAPTVVGNLGPDCIGHAHLQKSSTYGVIASFGAQCDRHIDVQTKSRLFVNGKLKKTSKVKKCKDLKQDAYCQSYITRTNPAGKQRFTNESTVKWKLTENSSWRTVVTLTTWKM